MANKISTGTLISSSGIIDFLLNYNDDASTPCPQNYLGGNLFSGTGNTATYIYSNQLSAISSFIGDKWYTEDQTWSNFCKNSFPIELSDLTELSSSDIANWEDFKNIVINSFIPLTNIRYCEFTKFTNSDYSTSSANVFLTDKSINGTHTTFKDLFMNNTSLSGKTIISSVDDFLSYGEILSDYNMLASSAGPGKIIKSGWTEQLADSTITESLNRLLLLCVKALNTIRTKLSCTFTDDMYNLRYKILLPDYITNLTSAITVLQPVNSDTYTLPTYERSPLSKYNFLSNYTFDKWMINDTITTRPANAEEPLTFSQTSLPSSFTIRPRLKYAIINETPTFISHTNGNGLGGGESDRFYGEITLHDWFNRSGRENTYYNQNKSRLAGIRFGDKMTPNYDWGGSDNYDDEYNKCEVTVNTNQGTKSNTAVDHIGTEVDKNGIIRPDTKQSSHDFCIAFVPPVIIDGKNLNTLWPAFIDFVKEILDTGPGTSTSNDTGFINIYYPLTTNQIDGINFDVIRLDGGHWRFLELVYIDIESSATINDIVI